MILLIGCGRGGDDATEPPLDVGGDAAVAIDASPGRGPEDAPSGPSPGSNATPEQRAACSSAGTAYCDKLNFCSHFVLEYLFGDLTTCAQRVGLSCLDEVTASGSNATATWVKSCYAGFATSTCIEFFNGNLPASCQGQAPGSLNAGAACNNGWQCAGFDCYGAGAGACGTCSTLATEGQSCASADCTPGLICDSQQICTAPHTQGGGCTSSTICSFPLVCKSSKCSVADPVGTTCDPNADTCDVANGVVCDPQTTKCAKPTLASAGGTCGVATDGTLAVCAASATCQVPSSGASQGSCLAAAVEGEPCDPTNGPGCLGPAYCNPSGVCALPDPSVCP